MTKIVTIAELYQLVPETKKLEGVNFTNLKHLLTSVIEQVEISGKWIFVQYLTGQPSLFIVREKEVVVVAQPQASVAWNPQEETSNHYDKPVTSTKKETTKTKNPVPEKVIENDVKQQPLAPMQESKLFVETTMPWK